MKVGSIWKHTNGNIYTIESVANLESTDSTRYPVTVVYRGSNGNLWARHATDWHRSMTLLTQVEILAERLQGMRINVFPGTDPTLSEEQKATEINKALDAIEAGDIE